MELREKIAARLGRFLDRCEYDCDLAKSDALNFADSILALPEIQEALAAYENELDEHRTVKLSPEELQAVQRAKNEQLRRIGCPPA